MTVGNQQPVFEDASYFFDGMDNMNGMPETIFLGPHMTDRPFAETGDGIRPVGTQEAKGQPASITGGPGINPSIPMQNRQRPYDYQEPTNPIRNDFDRMMTPVVSEPQTDMEPNRTVNAPVPPASSASGLDYDKPKVDTVYVQSQLARKTPMYFDHSSGLPNPDARKAYQEPARLLESYPDDGVKYNGEGYSLDEERHYRRNDIHMTIDGFESGDQMGPAPQPVFRVSEASGHTEQSLARALGAPAPPEIPMVMLAGAEAVADIPSITLAGLGFWPFKKLKKAMKRSVKKLRGAPPNVAYHAMRAARERKKRRRQRRMLRISDTVKMGEAEATLKALRRKESKRESMEKQINDLNLQAARLATRKAEQVAQNDPSYWTRFTRLGQGPGLKRRKPEQPRGIPEAPHGFYWKKIERGYEIRPMGPEAKAMFERALDLLRESERRKIDEAKHDMRVAEEEIQGLSDPTRVREVSEDARTPDELRLEGAAVAKKMIQNWKLPAKPAVMQAISTEVAGAMLKDIHVEREIAKKEVAAREKKLKVIDKAQAKAKSSFPAISAEAFLPSESGYF